MLLVILIIINNIYLIISICLIAKSPSVATNYIIIIIENISKGKDLPPAPLDKTTWN